MKKINGLKILKRFFKNLDFFGFQFSFDYKFDKKYRTAVGGIIFLIIIIFMIVFFSINFKDFLNRSKWNVLSYTTQIAKTDSIDFKNYTSTFAFNLKCEDVNEEKLNSLFKFTSKYRLYKRNDGEIERNDKYINFEKCTKSDFYNKFDEEFDLLGLDDLYCLNTEGNSMEGVYSSESFGFFQIKLLANFNTSDEEELLDKQEQILSILTKNECQISFYYITNVIDLHNYDKPITQFINSNFLVLRPDDLSKINIYFKLNEVNLDNDWFFSNYNRHYYISEENFERYTEYKGLDRFDTNINENDEFATMFLRAGSSRTIIYRKYQKIFELIATMASFFMVIIFIFTTFLNYYDYYFAYKSILKNFFKISDNSHFESKEILKTINKFIESVNLPDRSLLDSSKTEMKKENKNIYQDEKKRNKIKNKYGKKGIDIINFKEYKKPEDQKKKNNNYICQVVCQYMCPILNLSKGYGNERLKTIENNFFLKMDIRSYIKTSQLTDLFNYLMLSEGRCEIMNFISNPCVLFNNIDALNSINTNIKTYYNIDQEKINIFLRLVSDLKNKSNKSPLDEKFLNLIFKELKSLISN